MVERSHKCSVAGLALESVVRLINGLQCTTNDAWIKVLIDRKTLLGYYLELSVESNDVRRVQWGKPEAGFFICTIEGSKEGLESLRRDPYTALQLSDRDRAIILREIKDDFANWVSKVQ